MNKFTKRIALTGKIWAWFKVQRFTVQRLPDFYSEFPNREPLNREPLNRAKICLALLCAFSAIVISGSAYGGLGGSLMSAVLAAAPDGAGMTLDQYEQLR